MNNVSLTGRLTKDPELRYTQSNTAVVAFTVAVNRAYAKDTVDWVDCVAWRKTAEFISQWFTKGSRIEVTGTLQTRSWQDKSGNNRKSTEVIATEVGFGESRQNTKKTTEPETGDDFQELDDDELPF